LTRSNVDSADACACALLVSANPDAATMLPIAAVPTMRLLICIVGYSSPSLYS
jgi:hypothetical protein